MRRGRPSGAIKPNKRPADWDEADRLAIEKKICSACLMSWRGEIKATHRIAASCGCGIKETAFCEAHTREFGPVLEASCGFCKQERKFSEPIRIDRSSAQQEMDEAGRAPQPKTELDKAYLGEEADEWLA